MESERVALDIVYVFAIHPRPERRGLPQIIDQFKVPSFQVHCRLGQSLRKNIATSFR